jgi:hypothetical protein
MLAANITPVHSSPETESTTVEQANTTEELLPIQVSGWRTRKTNPVWKHFAPLHISARDYKCNTFVCLLCRNCGTNSTVKLGNGTSLSPTGLKNHLRSNHREEYDMIIRAQSDGEKNHDSTAKPSIMDHLTAKTDVKLVFKNNYTRWIVEENQKFNIGASQSFRNMIGSLSSKVTIPDRRELLYNLDGKRESTIKVIKTMLNGNSFSITVDHWTSIANENYGAITLHFIQNFELQTIILSFMKHQGGCSGEELAHQLYTSLQSWGLDVKKHLVAIVSDSCSNMNKFGMIVCNDHDVQHHYCADHILHLTALKAFATDTCIEPLKSLKALVNFINSSPQSNAKLVDCQKKISPGKKPLKLLNEVRTRWWSTYSMIQRANRLKQALLMMKRNEVMLRQQNRRQLAVSKLEQLCLDEDDFNTLGFLEELLAPFADAQRCLEGEKYVNISLIVLVIKKLQSALVGAYAAAEHEPQLQRVIEDMMNDFNERWGEEISYSSDVERVSGNRQKGIPKYAYWGAVLDPRTKRQTLALLEQDEKRQIWSDIQDELVTVAIRQEEEEQHNNGNICNNNNNDQLQRRPKGAATFLTIGYSEESNEGDDENNTMTIIADITLELAMYKADKGCLMNNENGNYYDPLEWWQNNHAKFPNVWKLAKCILSIPATSAPSERVFSAAANIIDKKRARITADNAEILMFLRGNKTLVNWDA